MTLLKKQSLSSKLVEKCVAKQQIDCLDANGLNVLYQSAFRKLHSTETSVSIMISQLPQIRKDQCRLEGCVLEIDTWTLLNKLKLNKDKTELLVTSSLHRARPPLSHIYVCDERVLASPRARNIGVLFDESLSMVPQVTAMCKSAFYHLRKQLTFAAQILVQALVTSKLDYCNSLLYGLPKNVIKQLQRVQNAAARVVTLSPKFCHITPVLANLHWLSIYLRIELKILVVTCNLQCYLPARDLRSSKKKIYLSCLLLT